MRVLVAGASGFVGQAVVRALIAHGHETIGLVHTAEKKQQVEKAGGKALVGDLNDPSIAESIKDVDAIIHAAQPAFYSKRISQGLVRQTGVTDRTWTERLLKAGAGRAKTFIYTSGCWVYGNRQDEVVDESSAERPFKAAVYKAENEKFAAEEAKRLGYQTCVSVRAGNVYGNGGTYETFTLGPMLKHKKARWIGSGDQIVSMIHVDDLGEIYAKVLEKSPGYAVYNATDDQPVSVRESYNLLAQKLSAPKPGGVPTWIVSLAGGLIGEALSGGNRASNAKAKEQLGWQLKYPTFREGLNEVARAAGVGSRG